jgi:hypothetical protein
MAQQKRNPQDKKRLSYQKDRRNNYGESSKSSRKNIPRSKARDIRRERRGKNQALHSALGATNEDQQVAAEVAARTVKRRVWEKSPDVPLRQHIAAQRHMKTRRSHRRAKTRRA